MSLEVLKKPQFKVGDLVWESSQLRPLLIVGVDEEGDMNWIGDSIYTVLESSGVTSQRYEYEVIHHNHDPPG